MFQQLRYIQANDHFKVFFTIYFRYSFIVGNDGRVYEGRGWNTEGAHTLRYNLCAHAIAYTGNVFTLKRARFTTFR